MPAKPDNDEPGGPAENVDEPLYSIGDLASEFEARNVRGITRRRRIMAPPLQQVGAIEARGTDANENVVRRRFGRARYLADLKGLRPAERPDIYRFHNVRGTPSGVKPR